MRKNKRKVLIGSPSYDGRIDVWYTNSLINSIKHSYDNNLNVDLIPMWVSFDALIQRSRNDTVFIALEQECDDLFWIDTDIEWQPEWLFKLLNYDVDVVGGTYPKKGDNFEMYVGSFGDMKPGPFGLKEVDALGTGFLRFSKRACQWLWDNSERYIETPETPGEKIKDRRWIFDVSVKGGGMISEDIAVCRRLREEGNFKIYLDTKVTCNHVGGKKYKGDFEKWYAKIKPLKNEIKQESKGINYLDQYKKFY
jgi:hypothetical protein